MSCCWRVVSASNAQPLKTTTMSSILFLVNENSSYLKIWPESFFMSPHLQLSPWAVSGHLAKQISCKWMLLLPSPLFTLASIRLSQSLSLCCLSFWMLSVELDGVLTDWAEIKEKLQPVRQAFSWSLLVCNTTPILYQLGVSASDSVRCGGCLSHNVNSNILCMSQSIRPFF